ncbi:zinc-binding dehydrogenase [Amycolatopsis mongoliensis]|uniref:Zinc-binding dehydrogenase n=1 Tax=Amycolatopsis mongoliensis TaxID=715475 RepID=A0A9Y2JPR6_9PSEU|nr:zinc-binding dehydrogenase [Amycolatopsis sp. 4-36]WIY01615.1 zinc-binding dehydrogenase [Amycolatopsis sp. 4-36]
MTETMLAGRLDRKTRRFQVEEVPVPTPEPDEVRIAVAAAGVCLSDLHLIDGTLNPRGTASAVTLGHEVAGRVEALGEAVPPGVHIGQRVTLQAGQSCGRCDDCIRRQTCPRSLTRGVHYDGGWAEYALARVDTLVPIPEHLPFDQAAIIPDAVSTPYAAITATAQVRPAQSAAVWGAGGLGAHAIQVLKLVGAAPIIAIDPLPAARRRALAFGADVALDPGAEDLVTQVRDATAGRGVDYAFDFAGVAAARDQAVAALAPAGALVLVGLTPEPLSISDSTTFCARKNRLLGHYGSAPQHVEELVAMTATRRLGFSDSISGHIKLADAEDAVHRLAHKSGDPVRLVLVP